MNDVIKLPAAIAFFLPACLCNAQPAPGETARKVHMAITFAGKPVGEASYAESPGDAFTADTSLSVATQNIKEHIDGHYAGGKIVDYAFAGSTPSGNVKILLKGGRISATTPAGVKQDLPFPTGLQAVMGNLMPQFSESLLKAVDFKNKQVQTFRTYLVDGGSVISVRVTPKDEKVTAAGKVRRYSLSLGITTAEYAMTEDGRVVGLDVPGQKIRFVADGWNSIYEDPFAKYPELSPAIFEVRKLPTQHMKTRDGVDLVQDVFLPVGDGKFPVVFARTPYGRGAEALSADFYVKRGYAFVAQDCRGRFDSGGEWDPFVHERADGTDAINWIAAQPWCDGNVGMIGASYGGFVQWAAAAGTPPALKCIVPQVSPPLDAMHNLPYDNGIFFLYGDIWWSKIVSGRGVDMSSVLSSLPNPAGLKTLPLSKTVSAVLGHDVPLYQKWLDRTTLPEWRGWNFYDKMTAITIPALHISGWFDGDEIGTNMNWATMRGLSRTNQWLIYGPWTHFFNSSSSLGDTDFGPTAIIDLDTLYIRWFDTWLKHRDVGLDKIPRVQAFVMGENKWVTSTDWPIPTSKAVRYFLSGGGLTPKAKTKSSEYAGTLVEKPNAKEAPDTIIYDPAEADVPRAIMKVDPNNASTDATSVLAERGSLVYRSGPLKESMAITGPFEVELEFSSSAKDTDFFVLLLDLDETGHARAFGSSGKLRASYLQGFDRQRPLTPGKIYLAKLIPWDTAKELKKGHRLALAITCDGFPMFARNLGTAEPIKNATRMVKQRNLIYHDAVHPSSVKFRVLSN